ncbi:MAG: NAD(P)-binding protein [Desulfobacterales bacterium]|nr:NAD(P)-binding protein [Desulfobacterales bacterium]
MDMKDRLKIPRQPMPEQEPKVRARNFDRGPARATPRRWPKTEAARCLHVQEPRLRRGLPRRDRHPRLHRSSSRRAISSRPSGISRSTNALPAVCGRVCPQESQCERSVRPGQEGRAGGHRQPRAVRGRLRAGDTATVRCPRRPAPTGKQVAVVGAGPAGLTVAGDLVQLGHEVTIFEALAQAGRGAGLRHPRVPPAQGDRGGRRSTTCERLGVKIECNARGRQDRHRSTSSSRRATTPSSSAPGAGLPTFMNIPGENLIGVLLRQRVPHPRRT